MYHGRKRPTYVTKRLHHAKDLLVEEGEATETLNGDIRKRQRQIETKEEGDRQRDQEKE